MRTAALTVVVASLLDVTSVFGASYTELKSTAVNQCQAIDPAEYQTGLFFNPEGYRSYYVRSECFQRTAVQFRDEALCGEVKRRFSLLSSSWGYSGSRCRELVAQGAAADRTALEEMKRMYTNGAVTLRDFRVERNGNGRDFDVIPSFAGEYAHGYRLTFEIVPTDSGAAPILLHSSGYRARVPDPGALASCHASGPILISASFGSGPFAPSRATPPDAGFRHSTDSAPRPVALG